MDTIRIAAVMNMSLFGDIERNIINTRNWSERARENGVDVLCFPEMNITGYSLSDSISDYADSIPGRTSDRMVKISFETGMVLLTGMIEVLNGKKYISQMVTSPEGLLGVYRKVHLSPGERKIFAAGNSIPVFKWGKFKFGIGLCYDAHFPEFSTVCALKRADIIFFPHASPPPESAREKRDRWLRYLPARAYDNSVYVVACNQVGKYKNTPEFKGTVMFLDPRGNIIAEEYGEHENMLFADISRHELDRVRKTRMGYFLKERRPDVYEEIVRHK